MDSDCTGGRTAMQFDTASQNKNVDFLMRNRIKELKELPKVLSFSQVDNFIRWPILDEVLGGELVVLGSWEKEVEYLEKWFDERVIWFDSYISSLGMGQ